MKRMVRLCFVLLIPVAIAGCGLQAEERQPDKVPVVQAGQISASDNQQSASVPLAAEWPKEVPLIGGTIKTCVKNSENNFTAIIITKNTTKDIMAFYIATFTKMVDEPMNVQGNESNECTGMIGDWKVTVCGGEEYKDGAPTGLYRATLLVMKNK